MGITRVRRKIAEKIWGGRTPDEVLSKRFKIFVFIGIFLIGMFAVYRYFIGITFLPNFEWIIPVLVVTGSFSLYCGPSKFWRIVTRYFGVLAVISAFIVWFIMYGILPIHAFVWSGFIFAWLLAMRNKLSMFNKFKKLLWRTTLTAAIAIILFDVWTGLVGSTLTMGGSLWIVFLGQIPFTLFHLVSLVFVPPLVGLGKMMVRVKISVPVAVAAGAGVRARIKK
ncbi:MAG: hypothetical protein CEE41_03395 [Hadesarchaea archaeon B3_Hades]|nr:MAG: hypothetical protein CEE41_03395 [Hadesarchaea archaeon B3_Hades]